MYKELLESTLAGIKIEIQTLQRAQGALKVWQLITYNQLEGEIRAAKSYHASLEQGMRHAQNGEDVNRESVARRLKSRRLGQLYITKRFVLGDTYATIAESVTGHAGNKAEMRYATTVGLRLTSEHTAPDCNIPYIIKNRDARTNSAIWLPRIEETSRYYGGLIE